MAIQLEPGKTGRGGIWNNQGVRQRRSGDDWEGRGVVEPGNRGGGGPKRPRGGPRSGPARPGGAARGPIGLAEYRRGLYELVHPMCVWEVELDYHEGMELWKAGDPESARDGLRYALSGCRDNLWVHVALGRIALEEFHDPSLAEGHFGYAYELGSRAIPPGFRGRLPRDRPANQPFFEALDGLAKSLAGLGREPEAGRLRDQAARLAGDRPAGPGRPAPERA